MPTSRDMPEPVVSASTTWDASWWKLATSKEVRQRVAKRLDQLLEHPNVMGILMGLKGDFRRYLKGDGADDDRQRFQDLVRRFNVLHAYLPASLHPIPPS